MAYSKEAPVGCDQVAIWLGRRATVLREGQSAKNGREIVRPVKLAGLSYHESKGKQMNGDRSSKVWAEFWKRAKAELLLKALDLKRLGDNSIKVNYVEEISESGWEQKRLFFVFEQETKGKPFLASIGVEALVDTCGDEKSFFAKMGKLDDDHSAVVDTVKPGSRFLKRI